MKCHTISLCLPFSACLLISFHPMPHWGVCLQARYWLITGQPYIIELSYFGHLDWLIFLLPGKTVFTWYGRKNGWLLISLHWKHFNGHNFVLLAPALKTLDGIQNFSTRFSKVHQHWKLTIDWLLFQLKIVEKVCYWKISTESTVSK